VPASSSHTSTVTIRCEGPVALVLANNPPVNVITAAVRRDLRGAFAQIATDQTVKSVVLACEGSTFFSGADIAEFGSDPRLIDELHATCNAIEQCERPVVAAIQGFAFWRWTGAGPILSLPPLDTNSQSRLPGGHAGCAPGGGWHSARAASDGCGGGVEAHPRRYASVSVRRLSEGIDRRAGRGGSVDRGRGACRALGGAARKAATHQPSARDGVD
jgi:hypothetical protein